MKTAGRADRDLGALRFRRNDTAPMSLSLSVLDLVPITSGGTASEALRRTVDLAQLADRLGYARVWYAEHHGMPSIASSAPEIIIGHVASQTERIRVGSGGVMLPNHAPLLVAERFHTLAALFPDRIDLGLGRAPGTDPTHIRALRSFDAEQFPHQLAELVTLSRGGFPADHPFAGVRVTPVGVDLPPIWLLGSSGASAQFAGSNGLGYAFASHFSPTPAEPAFRAYRDAFEPSAAFPVPHAILAATVVCAETDAEARRLASTMELAWARIRTGRFEPLPSPEEALAGMQVPDGFRVEKGPPPLTVPDRISTPVPTKLLPTPLSSIVLVSTWSMISPRAVTAPPANGAVELTTSWGCAGSAVLTT